MAINKETSDIDRRSFVRINDDIYLDYLVLSEDLVESAIQEFNQQSSNHFNPINQLQALSINSQKLLEDVKKNTPELAEYLISIEERIQLLSHAIAQDQVGAPVVPNENVSLSAGGLSFNSQLAHETGTLIEISIIITPSYLHISALGAVVYCRREDDKDNPKSHFPFRIGVEFSHIHDADREALARHVDIQVK
ncbi:MAG: PilZ domain-containing protein [Gammaproteobacteria bacterium]|nr:PilZ domain-containing protein [Gammaproteobacteria bacterium]